MEDSELGSSLTKYIERKEKASINHNDSPAVVEMKESLSCKRKLLSVWDFFKPNEPLFSQLQLQETQICEHKGELGKERQETSLEEEMALISTEDEFLSEQGSRTKSTPQLPNYYVLPEMYGGLLEHNQELLNEKSGTVNSNLTWHNTQSQERTRQRSLVQKDSKITKEQRLNKGKQSRIKSTTAQYIQEELLSMPESWLEGLFTEQPWCDPVLDSSSCFTPQYLLEKFHEKDCSNHSLESTGILHDSIIDGSTTFDPALFFNEELHEVETNQTEQDASSPMEAGSNFDDPSERFVFEEWDIDSDPFFEVEM